MDRYQGMLFYNMVKVHALFSHTSDSGPKINCVAAVRAMHFSVRSFGYAFFIIRRTQMKLKKATSLLLSVGLSALLLSSCGTPEAVSSAGGETTSLATEGGTSSTETEERKENITPVPTESSQSSDPAADDTSPITADTREELAKGLLEAILSEDKDTAKRYGVTNKNYTLMQEALKQGKEEQGKTSSYEATSSDFEIYITGAYKGGTCDALKSEYEKAFVYVISPTLPTVSFHFQITYDYDIERYVLYSAFVDGMHYDKLLPRLKNEQPI